MILVFLENFQKIRVSLYNHSADQSSLLPHEFDTKLLLGLHRKRMAVGGGMASRFDPLLFLL